MTGATILCAVLAGCAPGLSTESPTDSPTAPVATADPGKTEDWLAGSLVSDVVSGRSVTVNFSGDLLWHENLVLTAERDAEKTGNGNLDFFPQLADLQDYVSAADVAICHSEVPFAPEGGPYSYFPLFAAPSEVVDAIAEVGWDVCTTASNHSLDLGWEGLERTLDAFDAAGIATVGTFRTEADASQPFIFTAENGVKVGIVSHTASLNDMPVPDDKPWVVATMDAEAAVESARLAKEQGADVVIVHMHSGKEYSHVPSPKQTAFAETVTQSDDVDLIIGQHAHVVQPITQVNGTWVFYGSGNLMAASKPSRPYTYEGYLATVRFTENASGGFQVTDLEFVPTLITKFTETRSARVRIIPQSLAGDSASDAFREQMSTSAERTRGFVHSLGAEGLVEVGWP